MSILKNKIVHCETEEQAKKLMKIAEEEGYVWCDGERPTFCTSWYIIGENGIAYFFDYEGKNEIAYELYDWLNNKNKSKMVEFTDILPLYVQQEIKETKVTNRNTTLGEKILVKDYEDDDWQERYFLTVANELVYTTATEDGRYPFVWKYGIKKQC